MSAEGFALLAKLLGAAALLAIAALTVQRWQEHYRAEGRDEVRAEWQAADTKRLADERQAVIAKQTADRAEEQRMAKAKEEKDREALDREKTLRERADRAERAADGMRNTIARLDAASRAERGAATCPAAEREADAAATARGLLGACTDRYRGLAGEAGALADQVVGLQDHVVVVQPEAAALLEDAAP